MGKWITLNEASREFSIPKHEILRLIEKREITASKNENLWLVSKDDLASYLDTSEDIPDKACDIRDFVLPDSLVTVDLSDLKFIMKSYLQMTALFRMIIHEMAMLIPDPKKRDVFVDISSGKSFKEVAEKYDLPNIKARYLYSASLKIIEKKADFLQHYREEKATLINYNRKLEIERKNLLRSNTELSEKLEKLSGPTIDLIEKPELAMSFIPVEVVKVLSQKIEETFHFSKRTTNCFNSAGIITLEDLLRFTKENGFEKLLNIRNFGISCLNEVTARLIAKKIITRKQKCQYYKYL